MKVETRWATAEDFEFLPPDARDNTMRGFALLIDGKVLALASLRNDRLSGQRIVSVDMDEVARSYPKALHAFTKEAMARAREIGAQSFLAVADRNVPRAEAWLERLGFEQVGETEAGKVYRWQVQARI